MPAKTKQAATGSSRYRRFIADRDAALEKMLNRARAEMHDALRGCFQNVKEKIAYRLSTSARDSVAYDSSLFLRGVDEEIAREFSRTQQIVGKTFMRLKTFSYGLALAGESEAIAQAKDKRGKVLLTHEAALEQALSNFFGENIGDRIQLAFDKLRRRLLDAVQLSRVQGLSVSEALDRIDRALPSGGWVKRSKRVLKPVKEAALGPISTEVGPVDFAQGIIDDELWDQITRYYLEDHVPTYRFRGGGSDADYFYKDWELERDLTHEFVTSVRAGQSEAAKQNGVVDFQWIAIIDDHTDECCAWRDGLTTREIERQLRGEHKDDVCTTSVPPAHPNCRCTIAPMLDTMPEVPESNAKEFEEWLNT